MDENALTPNELAFIALTNEYCHAVEQAGEMDRDSLVATMLKLLPRIYISATDLTPDAMAIGYLTAALDEATYDQARDALAATLGEEDMFLEVFVADMKYSDTPIAVSAAESLADLYQEFFDLLHTVEDAMLEDQRTALSLCHEHFTEDWGQKLCNVLRALHATAHPVAGEYQ